MSNLTRLINQSDLLYDFDQIISVLERLADELNQEFDNKDVLSVCVMNGSLIFFGQLVTKLKFTLDIDYVHATRYQNDTTGRELAWLREPQTDPAGKIVLVIDDIFDEGYTLSAIVDRYRELGASAVYTVVLAVKQGTQKVELSPEFTGLTVPNRYVYGFGMDYKGKYRNLPAIYALKDS